MKYLESNAIGDAGEHFFAYIVATVLGWPCRLLDVDIGIDAQIEVLDQEKNSTGQFIAVQIKATKSDEASLRIPLRHIEYWKTVDAPVLLALVNIKKKHVYFRHISTSEKIDNINSESIKYEFDTTNDRLTSKSAQILRKLGFEKEKAKISKILREVKKECDLIIIQTGDDRSGMIEDHDHYLDAMRDFKRLEKKMHEARTLVQHIKSAAGDCGYSETLNNFNLARSSLVTFLYECEFHHHEEASEIELFRDESIHYLTLSA